MPPRINRHGAVSASLGAHVLAQLDAIAAQRGITREEAVNAAIDAYLKANEDAKEWTRLQCQALAERTK